MTTETGAARTDGARKRLARSDLQAWATVYAERDDRIRLAASEGLGVNEITRITGLAKTTVLRILAASS
jgi:hypothetical protein